MVTPEDIEKLCQVAIERGERPSHEGSLVLEFRSGALRQYVALTFALGLFGSFVAIERIDFIQEQWRVNVLHQDEIDQWVVSANANGTARYVWHKHLLEDKGAILKEEFLPVDEDSAKAIVEKIAARFLPNRAAGWRTAVMKKRQTVAGLQPERWIDDELARCKFNDARHGKRLRKLLGQLSDQVGGESRGLVRIGLASQRRTASSPTRGSARKRFWAGIITLRGTGSPPVARSS